MSDNKYNIIGVDALKRAFKQNISRKFSFLLGAGCSITSGIPSANRCIWEWKYELYTSRVSDYTGYLDLALESSKRQIQRWCDMQPNFPQEGDDSEYEFYVKECFPFKEDRTAYFENLCKTRTVSIGYKALAYLAKKGVIKSVWTTNFDGITREAVTNYQVLYNEVNIEDKENIFMQLCKNNFLYVPLHGDYLKNELKNTEDELRNQESEFVSAMSQHFTDTNLIVVGYSGRDNSLMKALETAFSKEGARIYWCGREEKPSERVSALLNLAASQGRTACYVPISGFDELMVSLLQFSFQDEETSAEIARLKEEQSSKCQEIIPFVLREAGAIVQHCMINQILVKLPYDCYTFSISIRDQKEANKILNEKIKGKKIVARYYNGQVYAIGGYGEIMSVFKGIITDKPTRTPISKSFLIENYPLRKLFLNAILLGLVSGTSNSFSFKDSMIWDEKKVYKAGFYEALKFRLAFNEKDDFGWLTFKPTLFAIDDNITLIQKQNILREYADKLVNKVMPSKLYQWTNSLFSLKPRKDIFYPEVNPEFTFIVRSSFPYVKLLGEGWPEVCPSGVSEKQVYFSGIRIKEPDLVFYSTNGNYIKQCNPMKGILTHLPFDYPYARTFTNSVKIGVICPEGYTDRFYQFLIGLKGSLRVQYKDYVQDYPGFEKGFNCTLDLPSVNDGNLWIKCRDNQVDMVRLAYNICTKARELANSFPGIVIVIFIPSAWETKIFRSEDSEFSLHDYIKSHGAQNHYTTQLIKESSINNQRMRGRIYWWLSLAIFVKSGRIPWSLGSLDEHTAYAGIGFSLQHGIENRIKTVVGCSHLYNHFGQGLNFRLRKVDHPQFDCKKNPYLDEDEAYYFGISIIELFRDSYSRNPDRLVIHKRTPFKDSEIRGIVNAVSPFVKNIDLVSIEREEFVKLVSMGVSGNYFDAKYAPVKRGTCIVVSTTEALLWTQGSIDSLEKPNREYYPGGSGTPMPLRIKRFHGSSPIEQLASEILSFTKINWNSFDFYSTMPATIDSSNLVARIGKNLNHYNGNTFEFRYFI